MAHVLYPLGSPAMPLWLFGVAGKFLWFCARAGHRDRRMSKAALGLASGLMRPPLVPEGIVALVLGLRSALVPSIRSPILCSLALDCIFCRL